MPYERGAAQIQLYRLIAIAAAHTAPSVIEMQIVDATIDSSERASAKNIHPGQRMSLAAQTNTSA